MSEPKPREEAPVKTACVRMEPVVGEKAKNVGSYAGPRPKGRRARCATDRPPRAVQFRICVRVAR
jgi:hypothetical protein